MLGEHRGYVQGQVALCFEGDVLHLKLIMARVLFLRGQ